MPKLRVIIKPPPEPQGDAEQQTEALRDYLLQMSEELAYVLTHLEADNINDSTFERIQEMIPKAYTGLPPMDGAASSGSTDAWSRGNHRHPHDDSKADADDLTAHVADTANPHSVTKAQVGLGNVDNVQQYSASNPPPTPSATDVGAIPATEKGSAGGVAELDSNGMVPSAQLPSYVDDVLEYASLSAFPVTGESGKIYVALDTGRTYRWSGSAYVEISESLALGETSSTAYRGDRGKAAYDHSQTTSGNPHNVTAAEVGLGNVANERQYSAQNPPPLPTPADIGAATAQDLTDHVGDTTNPHGVTAAQVGLGNVDNVQQYSASNPPPVPDAEDISYDNSQSGLTATDLQAAVDELAGGGGGGGPSPSDNNPAVDGTAAPGTSTLYSRSDHVHPTDTSRQATITASGILKGDGQGGVSAATAGTDYQAPLTAGTDYATPAMIPTVPSAYTSNPAMDGTASPGSSTAWAKGDHVHPSDSTKANQSQLAYVESGTTASRAYAVGEYFCWNGLLYRVKLAISSGASFTVGTNCEATTVANRIKKFSLPKTTNGVGNISVTPSEVDYQIPVSVTITNPANALYLPWVTRYAGNYLVRVFDGSFNPIANASLTIEIITVEA